MENEKSKIPSWLQDKKKLLIIIIVILCLLVSNFTTALIGIRVANRVNSELKSLGINLSISNVFNDMFGQGLNGEYQNDYADEKLTFKKNGKMVYYAAGYTAEGTYEIEGSKLIMNINFSPIEFDIMELNTTQLIISNGYSMFSYTKVK